MNVNARWDLDYRYMNLQPTYIEKIDIKSIIDILNYKRYTVDNFRLLSVADPKQVVKSGEAVEAAKIYFSKDARPIDNSNKPKGWSVYYDNGIQILGIDRETVTEILNKRSAILNSRIGEMDDKIAPFHSYLEEVSRNVWSSLRDWARTL